MNNCSIEANYRKYIEHKKVVFVGACPNLLGRKLGKVIDSYDVVIRSNDLWRCMGRELEIDYGKRCDITYLNNQYCKNIKPLPVSEMKLKGVSWICMKSCSDSRLLDYSTLINVRTYRHIIDIVAKALPTATAGAFLCTDILRYNPDEFYYTGIDFFASRKPKFEYDNYREYLPNYLPEKIRKEGNRINIGKLVDAHNFYENARYICGLFKQHPNFKTDAFLLDLLYGIVEGRIKQGDITWK